MVQRAEKNYLPVYLVFFLSLVYLAFLLSSAQPGVFFSSDGGIKYLVVKQLTEGHGFKYMYLSQPQWVQQIWGNGYFPFKPPFVYPSPEGYLFVFPPAFQIINAFFYAHFGNAGLYIIPVCSTLLLWLSLVLLLRRCGIAPLWIAAGLFILVFCSPLTIYGATYWEHMTAILLLFAGLAFLVSPRSGMAAGAGTVVGEGRMRWAAGRASGALGLGLGLASGLAAWFRPEAMMMNILYGLALVYLYIREKGRPKILFLAGMAVGVGSFLLFNKLEFDSFFGIHSRQVLKDSAEGGVEVDSVHNLIANNLINTRHYLFVLLLLPVLYMLMRYRKKLTLRTTLLVGIVLAFCVLTPFMVPNDGGRQWGARYFLPVIPVTLVALLLIEKEWAVFSGPRRPVWLASVVLLFVAYTFDRNTYKGGIKTLRWENYHRILPSMDFINHQPGKVVVVAFPYIAMELGYTFDKEYFFLAPDDSSLQKLLPQLKQQGVHEFTYIYDVRVPRVRAKMLTDTLVRWPADQGDFEFRKYTIQ